ncbi:hypothetical protein D047_1787A, partial [Vibrio parahaemolyticus VPTS-2010_2]
MDTAL